MNTHTFRSGIEPVISPLAVLIGVALCALMPLFSPAALDESVIYFVTMCMLGVGLVLSSRFRNRGSFWWIIVACTISNGMWYVSTAALESTNAPLAFVFLAVCAMIGGRTFGVRFAMSVERKYHLVANVNLDPKQIERFLVNARWGWPLMGGILLFWTVLLLWTQPELGMASLVVVGLGFLQNVVYVQSSRIMQRGKNNPRTVVPVTLLEVTSNVCFFLSFGYLAHKHMPLALFVSYTLTTVLGTTFGIWQSMRRELRMRIGGDDHLKTHTPKEGSLVLESGSANETARVQRKTYATLLAIGLTWIVMNEPIARLLGVTLTPLVFPIPELATDAPRWVILCVGAIIMFAQQASHTLVQGSGNRNHVLYHVVSIAIWATFSFMMTRAILKNPTWDIIPVVVAGAVMGALFGRALSGRIETRLTAWMDVPPPQKNQK